MECAHCKEKKNAATIACDSCNRPVHREQKCSGLNASELKVMDLKGGRNLKFYCEDCQMGVKLIPKLLASIDLMKAEIDNLKSKLSSSQFSFSEDNVIEEISERQKKKKNIMIYNLPQKSDSMISDLEETKTLIKEITNEDLTVLKTIRVGKINKNGNRPLKIILSDPQDAIKVIKNRRNISKERKIFIEADLTRRQMEYSKKVREEMIQRRNDGEDVFIRYVNGIPRVTKNLKK